jgi:hypothetical protein
MDLSNRSKKHMSDEVLGYYTRIVDAFKAMRDEMYAVGVVPGNDAPDLQSHRNQRYAENLGKKADELYNAIREFAPKIGAVAPYLPIDDAFDDRTR